MGLSKEHFPYYLHKNINMSNIIACKQGQYKVCSDDDM